MLKEAKRRERKEKVKERKEKERNDCIILASILVL